MLDRLRKNQSNFVFSFLILAIVAVMALYGVNQLNEDQPGAGGAAAWVNGEPVTNREFQQVLEATLEDYRAKLGGQLDERFIAQFQIPQHTLDQMVEYKLMAQTAGKMGYRIPDEELADYIRKAPVFQRQGKFDAELYRRVPNRGVEEKRIRERLVIQRFQTYLADRIKVPPQMAKREYELKETKANVVFAKINFNNLAGKPNPSAGEVEAFLKSAPEADLTRYYESHRQAFSTPAAVSLRQIRVGLPFQAPAEKKAAAKTKIESLAKEVTAENFEAMARKHSDDEHASKGGNAGWVNRGTLEAPLEEAINKLKPGEVSPPVETSFGYYLLQVKEMRPEVVKPLDQVKKEVAKEVLKQNQVTQRATAKKQEWEKKVASGQSIEAELKAANIDVKKTGPFSLGQGYLPQIGQSEEMIDAVFSLTKAKPVAPKLYAQGSDYYFLKLESLQKPKAESSADEQAATANAEAVIQNAVIKQWIDAEKDKASIRIEAQLASPQQQG